MRDKTTRRRIQVRIDRLASGNAGETRGIEGGITEMKIDFGPGYRVYFTRCGDMVVILLCGGDKSTQNADIKNAIALAGEL